MNHAVIWVPLGLDTAVGAEFPELHGAMVPHCVPAESVAADGAVQAQLTAETLGQGVLVTDGMPNSMSVDPLGDWALEDILRVIQVGYGMDSLDALCAKLAAQVREAYGPKLALQALRRTIVLIRGSVMCRGDLMVAMLAEAGRRPADAPALIDEVAAQMGDWLGHDTSRCRNEAVVFACGFAAMAFRRETSLRDRFMRNRPRRMAAGAWLDAHEAHFLCVKPYDLASMAGLFDLLLQGTVEG